MSDLNSYVSETFNITAKIARKVSDIPSGTASAASLCSEINFLKTAYPEVKGSLDKVENSLLDMANFTASLLDTEWKSIKNISEDYLNVGTDLLDRTLEKIDTFLDESKGIVNSNNIKTKNIPQQRKNPKRVQIEQDSSKIAKANSTQIFVPICNPKEDRIKLLYQSKKDFEGYDFSLIPYEKEMKNTTLEWVDTLGALTRLAISLEQEKIIAIDLENHSFHSYYGFTCLMQISTPTNDYLIDVIALREHIGPQLSRMFADAEILKVFHGAQSDILWLQRDFNIFIVNMFDTFIAAKALKLPAHSLAYLLREYVNVETDKQYQMADWRTRPLPEAMKHYAQMDTHYLLYIFSCLRKSLYDVGGSEMLMTVFRGSSLSALTLYKPESFDQNGWRSILDRSSVKFSEREKQLVKAIYEWRESIALEDDISPPAVLPNYIILKLMQGSHIDPEILLGGKNSTKFAIALKHLEELREILETRKCTRNLPPSPSPVEKKVSLPVHTHIKFEIDKDLTSEEVLIEKQVKSQTLDNTTLQTPAVITVSPNLPKPSRKISFATAGQPKRSLLDIINVKVANEEDAKYLNVQKSVLDNMSIVKVQRAGVKLLEEHTKDAIEDKEMVPSPEQEVEVKEESLETVAMVLRSGEIIEENSIPSNPDRILSLVKSTAQPKTFSKNTSVVDNTFDINAAASNMLLQTKRPKIKDEAPNNEPIKEILSHKRQPRLTNAPKSGQRSCSFRPN